MHKSKPDYRKRIIYSKGEYLWNGDKEKAHGRIGIVPYVYEDAHNYYLALFEAKEKNEQVVVSDYVLPTRVVCIRDPERSPMTGKRKLFSFLDEEENEWKKVLM